VVTLEDAYRLAESYEGALWASLGKGRLNPEPSGVDAKSLVHIDTPAIRGIAFYESAPNTFILRLLNVSADPRSAKLRINAKKLTVERADLAGNPQHQLTLQSVEGGYVTELNFGRFEVLTLVLRRD
jgi:hypothetical protein